MNSITDESPPDSARKLGLVGATSVGVGAIVGGGILALAGTAFAATGPSAIVAFALNGAIAILTALSFSEMASRFPESGGTYTFARKVMSVQSAFSVGWVVGFASIVAGVLYALGLAHFLIEFANGIFGEPIPAILGAPLAKVLLAIAATLLIGGQMVYGKSGGGKWINLSKLIVFAALIAGGLAALIQQPAADTRTALTPFFSAGLTGLVQAMGYTFIALQGFDLIAAVGGEVKHPQKNIPRAMIGSLVIALAIYLPLLFLISSVGFDPTTSVSQAAAENPEGVVAAAARNFLGSFGYWLVVVAAILAMYSALQANIYAASRIIFTMARDRTLPSLLSQTNVAGNPGIAVVITAAIVAVLIVLIPDVSTAGAASSLIFLMTFALGHWITVLVRKRSNQQPAPFQTIWFPMVPATGGIACVALAIFQGIMVPSAGLISLIWLGLGAVLFAWLFAGRAKIRDASAAAMNPELLRLRGRSPLVLVPIANPGSAEPLITLASSMVPQDVGRVLLQSIVVAPDDWDPVQNPGPLDRSKAVLERLLTSSTQLGIKAESLTTVASHPMQEIARVASLHRCQSVVMGLSNLNDPTKLMQMESLLAGISMDVVILRARDRWQLGTVQRILVPVAGAGGHEFLMSQVIGSLARSGNSTITYLRVVSEQTPDTEIDRLESELGQLAEDQLIRQSRLMVLRSNDPSSTIAAQAAEHDLVVLGASRTEQKEKVIGQFTKQIASKTDAPLVVLSSHSPNF